MAVVETKRDCRRCFGSSVTGGDVLLRVSFVTLLSSGPLLPHANVLDWRMPSLSSDILHSRPA